MIELYATVQKMARGLRFYAWRLLFSWEFEHFGRGSRLFKPRRLGGVARIRIGERVCIRDNGWIEVSGSNPLASLQIGDGTYIGDDAHIFVVGQMRIGNEVLVANRIYIADNIHEYENTSLPIMRQRAKFKGPVIVGDGAWLGENVCILGASVGRNSVIAANSVVVSDVPDFCVAAGAPARIIKRLDPVLGRWVKC